MNSLINHFQNPVGYLWLTGCNPSGTAQFRISGSMNGLSSPLTLTLNSRYQIRIAEDPAQQLCNIRSIANGMVQHTNITDVQVDCRT